MCFYVTSLSKNTVEKNYGTIPKTIICTITHFCHRERERERESIGVVEITFLKIFSSIDLIIVLIVREQRIKKKKEYLNHMLYLFFLI